MANGIFGERATALLLGFALCVLSMTGCLKEMLFVGYLIGGPPSVEPDFEKVTKKSMTDYKARVVVFCYAPTKLKLIDPKVDQAVAKQVAYKLRTQHVLVINPTLVQKWLDEHPDWETPDEIGAYFKAKYVIQIDLSDYNLYEKGSQSLLRGRAEAKVSVIEMDGSDSGERIYSTDVKSIYPLAIPRSTYDTTESKFRKNFLERLTNDIGWKFYEKYNGEDMKDAT